MTPEQRWQQVKSVLDQTLDQEPGERVAFVTRACRGDEELLHEVESYLRSAVAVEEGFLEQPAVVLPERESLPAGHAIGPYRVVREIGRGGMGTVYLAERADQEFDQRVAIKLVKRGMDTDEIVRRFRHERQILAQLEHPDIARLLDGGSTPEGLSYLAMEHVEGRPIDVYCRENDLPERARLELFRRVCGAVHFAHQRLVVHRDLKPGNILVTADGDPKLLDFGIAKLLDPAAHPFMTLGGIQPLTPEYASPEQLKGEAIGTPSDVYSLGVLLHLLLAGELPGAMARRKTGDGADTATTPTADSGTGGGRPSRRTVKVKGELGTIVAKAMHEEPGRRYASAEQLAEDLRRYLTGFPVKARPDSFGYRAGKFVRRYPWQVAAAATVLALILASAATATVLYQRAERERVRAEAVSGLLVELIEGNDPGRARGEDLKVADLLDPSRARIEKDPNLTPDVRAALFTTLGRVYRELGRYTEAFDLDNKALQIRDRLFGPDDPLVAESLHNVATVLRRQGKAEEAEPLVRQALEIQTRHGLEDHPDYVRGLNNLAGLLEEKKPGEAEALYHEALERKRNLYLGDHPDVAVGLNNLGRLLHAKGDLKAAEPLYREALEMRRRLAGDEPHPQVARSANNLATLLEDRGATAEAEKLYLESLAIRRTLHPDGHQDVVLNLNNLGNFYVATNRPAQGEASLREAFDMAGRLEMSPRDMTLLRRNLGAALLASGKAAEAEPLLREALAAYRESGRIPWRISDTASLLGACLDALGRRSEAEPLLREGAEGFPAEGLNADEARAARDARARWAAFQEGPTAAAPTPAGT